LKWFGLDRYASEPELRCMALGTSAAASRLSVNWTGAGEYYGEREDRSWKPVNLPMRRYPFPVRSLKVRYPPLAISFVKAAAFRYS